MIAVSLALATSSSAARAGVPAWCSVRGGTEKPSSFDLERLYAETDYKAALYTLVSATCYPNSDTAPQARQIEATRQAWSKKLGLGEADWADVAAWAHMSNVERNAPTLAPSNSQLAWSAYTAFDQYAGIVNSRTGTAGPGSDPSYLTDALGAKLTETGRLGYITTCLDPSGDDTAARWAMCERDIAALDPKKLVDELRADTTHNGYQRMVVRLAAYEMINVGLPKHAADVKALKAKDPAYAKMFALAEAAHKAWSPDAKLVALAAELDDARVTNSRRATEGCEARTWAAWKAHVAALGAKAFAALHHTVENSFVQQAAAVLINEADGYLASLALEQCASLVGKTDYVTRVLGAAMQRWPGYRGPRTAAQTAILTGGLQLDDRSAKIELPEIDRAWLQGTIDSGAKPTGAIAKLEVAGDTATVTFAKEKITQTRCTQGHYTNRVNQILPDGTVVYYYLCTAEITETISVAPAPPQKIHARYAAGLKVGMTVTLTDNTVIVGYAKGNAKVPAVVAGAEVR